MIVTKIISKNLYKLGHFGSNSGLKIKNKDETANIEPTIYGNVLGPTGSEIKLNLVKLAT